MSRRKPGRPKNPASQRNQSTRAGRAGHADNPALLAHRAALHGMPDIGDSLLDILARKNALTLPDDEPEGRTVRNELLRDAGRKFARLHRAVWGASDAAALDLDAPRGRGHAEPTERDVTDEQQYWRQHDILVGMGRRVLDAVENLCVYNRAPPDWRRPVAIERLRQGLAALAEMKPRTVRVTGVRPETVGVGREMAW